MSTIKTKPFDLEAIKNGAKWGIFYNNVAKDPICVDAWNHVDILYGKNDTAIKYDGLSFLDANGTFNGSYHVVTYQILLIEEPKLASDLSDLKVGDKVWDFKMGWGEVENIRKGYNYPINIRFNKDYMTYTMKGKNLEGCNQSLFLTEIKFEIPEV